MRAILFTLSLIAAVTTIRAADVDEAEAAFAFARIKAERLAHCHDGKCETEIRSAEHAFAKLRDDRLSPPAPKKKVEAPATKQVISVSYRQPQGHTHTCANGHTWDHAMTSGHNCPVCGLPQYVQDRSPRMVAVKTVKTVPVSTQTKAEPYDDRVIPAFIREAYASGCQGGNCPNLRR